MFSRREILSLVAAVAVASCGGKKDDASGSSKAVDGKSSGPASISGAGSTFQKAFQEQSIASFKKKNPDIKVTYGGGGSGTGRQQLSDQVLDFAGSDSPFKDTDKPKGGDVLYFPVLLGPISLSYNVEGVDKLNLSADTIAKIFAGDIKKWNDPAIAADNPDNKSLPDTDITVVHRSDASGTTDNFTKYLAGAAKDTWKLGSGSSIKWPDGEQTGNGNGGVAQTVKTTKGAIGYVDLSDAKAAGLKYASVKNQAGKYIEPTSDSASAAGDGIDIKDNLTFSALDAKGDASYPITYQSWVIVYAKPASKEKAAALKTYLKYLLTDAQKDLPSLDFAPLPKSLQDKAVAQIDKISG